MAKTAWIVLEQEALSPWAGQIDIFDAALVHHVMTRLTRRKRQRIVKHAGTACAWVHLATVGRENWLLSGLGTDTLSKRFGKLVRVGLLVRKQIPLGRGHGSHTHYGLSSDLRERLEAVDSVSVGQEKTRTKSRPKRYEADLNPAQCEADGNPAHSLGLSQSGEVESGDCASPPLAAPRMPHRFSESREEEEARSRRLEGRKEVLRRQAALLVAAETPGGVAVCRHDGDPREVQT